MPSSASNRNGPVSSTDLISEIDCPDKAAFGGRDQEPRNLCLPVSARARLDAGAWLIQNPHTDFSIRAIPTVPRGRFSPRCLPQPLLAIYSTFRRQGLYPSANWEGQPAIGNEHERHRAAVGYAALYEVVREYRPNHFARRYIRIGARSRRSTEIIYSFLKMLRAWA
jgi:hypothetical protein